MPPEERITAAVRNPAGYNPHNGAEQSEPSTERLRAHCKTFNGVYFQLLVLGTAQKCTLRACVSQHTHAISCSAENLTLTVGKRSSQMLLQERDDERYLIVMVETRAASRGTAIGVRGNQTSNSNTPLKKKRR